MNLNNPCVAHRGWSGMAPENTLSAFKLAVDHADISMIELDVQFSLDGIPVVIHVLKGNESRS
jgi:glycerophosphoryl diester phosphodiesterase